MTRREILAKIDRQRNYRQSNGAPSVAERKLMLKRLAQNIREMTPKISLALEQDLGKSETESYMTEIGLVLEEIGYMRRHLRKLARPKRAYTPLAIMPARSFRMPSPYGIALIISPWNYPFLLSIQPLVDAIAAGNSVIVKPSEYSPQTSQLIADLIERTFEPGIATTVLGGVVACTILLDQDLDYIFYTGSTRVGEIVMKKAAKHFTPVTLEMGGKSPCLVDQTANLKLAARRIVFGKLLNAGQTCVAPDYVYCHTSVREKLVAEIKREIRRQYGEHPLKNPAYPRIVNRRQFKDMAKLIEKDKVLCGGEVDAKNLKIAPTLVTADFSDRCMENEIFGPILPILTFDNLLDAVEQINALNPPLALYLFSRSRKAQKIVMQNCHFGGGCINDTIMHIANNHLGFGGLKQSGIGAYHGKVGFETFTHQKSLLKNVNWLDLPMRYQPFGKVKTALIKLFLS